MRKTRKFHRERGQRKAFLKGLAANLVLHGRIKTTLPRAKELRPFVERLVTYAKKDQAPTAHRAINRFLPKTASKKLITEIAPKYKERGGGYTRIIKLGQRGRDAAEMAFIEFV